MLIWDKGILWFTRLQVKDHLTGLDNVEVDPQVIEEPFLHSKIDRTKYYTEDEEGLLEKTALGKRDVERQS
jgi:hypothetical protein